MKEPNIKIKAWCPTLHPKQSPEDMEVLKHLYSEMHKRLDNMSETMGPAECTKMIITIEAGDTDEGST